MSFATIALFVAGAGVLAMAVTAIAVAFVPVGPEGKALVALAGIVLTIGAMAFASNRITKRAIRAEFGDDPDEGIASEVDAGGRTPRAGGEDQPGRSDGLQSDTRDGLG